METISPVANCQLTIIDTFKQLLATLENLTQQICNVDYKLPVWFKSPNNFPCNPKLHTRQRVSQFLQQLEYLDHQQPREALIGAGIVCASPATIEAIVEVNLAKDAFRQAVLDIKQHKNYANEYGFTSQLEEMLNKRPNSLAVSLTRAGLARLHLKQCYRHIPFFTAKPEKVSWTWANTKAITKITTAMARELLLKRKETPAIIQQLNKLQALAMDEPLAIVQELAPHLRVNVLLAEKKRVMIKGALPIFYVGSELELPTLTLPKAKTDRANRVVRSDVKLEQEAFLPAIRVHRYLQN